MANSYMVGNAPAGASYAAPLVGFQIGDRLADLPNQAWQAQQRQRTLALQQPILDPNTGQPSTDPTVIQNELLRRGGAEYAEKLLPFIYGQQIGNQNAATIGGAYGVPGAGGGGAGGGTPAEPGPPRAPAPPGGTAGPGNVSGAAAVRQPTLSAVGTDNEGADTIRSIATETASGRDVSQIIPRWASAIGVKPDDPLSPEQVTKARAIIGRTMSSMSGGQGGPGAGNPAILAAGPSESDGGGVAPSAASGVSGTPGAGQSGVRSAPAPAAGGGAPFAPAPQPRPAAAPRPAAPAQAQNQGNPSTDPRVEQLRQQEGILRANAARYAAMPGGQANAINMTAAADSIAKERQALEESNLRATEPTRTAQSQLTAGNPGAQVKAGEDAAKSYQAQYQQLQQDGQMAQRDILPRLRTAMSIVHDISTGPIPTELKNQYLDQLGVQHGAAVDDETFNGLVHGALLKEAQSMLARAGATGGAGAARGIGPLVDMLQGTSAMADKTPAGNARLLEIAARAYQQQVNVAKEAQTYASQHGGQLDQGWDAHLSDYYDKHPMITPEEQREPALLTAPRAPATVKTPRDADAWVASQRLKPGEPFWLSDGRVGHVPQRATLRGPSA